MRNRGVPSSCKQAMWRAVVILEIASGS